MEPLQFTEDELEIMSRKDLQMHAKTHGLKANAKNSILIEQLREIFQSRNQKTAEPQKDVVVEEVAKEEKAEEKAEEKMEVETKKRPARRGAAKEVPKEEKVEEKAEEKMEVETKKRPAKRGAAKEVPKEEKAEENVEEKAEEMEVETKKPAKRGTKRVASAPVTEEPKPKEAKVEEKEASPQPQPQPVREKSPVPVVVNNEPYRDFMSPKVVREKLAHSARTFLTPVKDKTPSKVMITPRALKPSQGKILPKSPFQFNITNADKKSPQTPSTKKSQEARMKIKSTLTSLQQDLMPISALDIYTVGVQTAPRLISAGAIRFVSHVLRRFIINICSYALAESDGKEIPFTSLTSAASEVFEEGEIHSQAIRESLSARDRYLMYKDEDVDLNTKAGLSVSVDTLNKLLTQIGVKAEFNFVIGLTAICEYLIAEIFEVCPTINVENDLIITRDIVTSSLKTDPELDHLLSPYVTEENEVISSENQKNLQAAQNLVDSLKNSEHWSENGATEQEIAQLESTFKSKLPVQLSTFFLAQNGNDAFGINNIAAMIAEHESSGNGDLLNILEFIPLKSVGNNEYDCYDSTSGSIIRLILPMVIDEPRTFPVVATDLSDYIQRYISGKLTVPNKVESTLGSVNPIASQVCDLFKSATNAEEAIDS